MGKDNDSMNVSRAKKMTVVVNTVILGLVLGLLGFFIYCDAPLLVYFSIPTILVYLVGYVLVYFEKLDIYVWMVYIWITLYMGVATVCLGPRFGFHLYCMSMIPIIFVTEYLAYKLERKSLKAFNVSIVVAVFALACTGYSSYFGPIYERDTKYSTIFWVFNSIIVFSFLIFYSKWIISLVIASEEKLTQMAHMDKLTGLFNRHYMMTHLDMLDMKQDDMAIAMADIDFFKKINDTYGHSAGDYVLMELAKIMHKTCKDWVVSRWGGEEFLLLKGVRRIDEETNEIKTVPFDYRVASEEMEALRNAVENYPFVFEGQEIRVTLTIGVAKKELDQAIDAWIECADQKLYEGKHGGRNRVIS